MGFDAASEVRRLKTVAGQQRTKPPNKKISPRVSQFSAANTERGAAATIKSVPYVAAKSGVFRLWSFSPMNARHAKSDTTVIKVDRT